MPGDLEIKESAGEGHTNGPPGPEVPTSDGPGIGGPRLTYRDGMAHVEGCDVPVWQLEMARRAGSPSDALLGAFPCLTPAGLDLAFAYAQQHRDEIDALIEELGPTEIPSEDEEDDEDEYQADLDEMFEKYGEVFRRLAQ